MAKTRALEGATPLLIPRMEANVLPALAQDFPAFLCAQDRTLGAVWDRWPEWALGLRLGPVSGVCPLPELALDRPPEFAQAPAWSPAVYVW